MSPAKTYLKKIAAAYAGGDATELTHRPALQEFLEQTAAGSVDVVHEPKRTVCGAPDFILLRNNIPVGHVECKDIGADLERVAKGEQLRRYLEALPNLLFTDYLSFRWYHNGELRMEARLARHAGGKLHEEKSGAVELEKLLGEFFNADALTVATAEELAKRMAAQALLLYDGIMRILRDENKDYGNLGGLLDDYRKALIPKLQISEFADMQAQTAAYGLFAARYRHQHQGETGRFTRKDAAFIETNPFLHEVFVRIAGPKMDERIAWIADNLADLLNRVDMLSMLEDFGDDEDEKDPIIYFYEHFLKAYNPELRELRGVYYTPAAVVSWIVRSVDYLLRDRFGIAHGLADNAKCSFRPEPEAEAEESHRVLILDPAVGTGTFLCEVIDHVHRTMKDRGLSGAWQNYARDDLLPRLFGFEFLMASYAICYLKLEMKLDETKVDATAAVKDRRLNVYLTNALEKSDETVAGPLFAHEIVREANEARVVKQKKPVMVVLGNPPYSGHSANKGKWITNLLHGSDDERAVADYFSVDGGPLDESNPKWLNDDYVRFIRFAHRRIERTGEGVLGFITNHSWVDNRTFRGMRQSLLEDFDEIYLLDLHGNSRRRERAPDGGKDENIFQIQQGVAIGLFIRRSGDGKTAPARVFHADLWGEQNAKRDRLKESDVNTIKWCELSPKAPYYLFIPRDDALAEEYEKGWIINKIFPVNSVGITTARDKLTIRWTEKEMEKTVSEFAVLSEEKARENFCLDKDSLDWKISRAQDDLREHPDPKKQITSVLYRPFDQRFTWYSGKSGGFHCRPRPEVMRHMRAGKNFGLCVGRAGDVVGPEDWNIVHVADSLTDLNLFRRGGGCLFPLYLYPEADKKQTDKAGRKLNIAPDFLAAVKESLGKQPQPEAVLHYIYAVLHSPEYRRRYRDSLKMDFPFIPVPRDVALFGKLVAEGKVLVRHHLMQDTGAETDMPGYNGDGNGAVEKIRRVGDKVYINQKQFFAPVSDGVWTYFIGGYQPAQKWLKDRKGRELNYDDIRHYRNICAVLAETLRAMKRIDKAVAKHGGWGW